MATEAKLRALPLRERKRVMTRQAILNAAERLFEERGFEHVTVAEIADAANVSVKTLFVYFRLKEDLVFANSERLLNVLVAGISTRSAGKSVLDGVADALIGLVHDPAGGSDLETFHRSVGDSAAIHNRLRRLWQEYEDALTVVVSAEMKNIEPTPR